MVRFSRSELIRLLGWPDTGPSYKRLDLAFHRWLGVSLHYENAWWDKGQGRWTTVGFHIIESFKLTSESGGPRGQMELPLSRFTWNEDVFRSFQAGYLKQLDFDFYRDLTLPTSKRIYRFLDKRFYHRDEWRFDLKEFAHDHIGLSRKYEGNTQLARKLEPAIRELEERGFLARLPEERYQKVSSRKGSSGSSGTAEQNAAGSGRDLDGGTRTPSSSRHSRPGASPRARPAISWRPTPRNASERSWPRSTGSRSEKDGRVLRSPAGFLVQSIRENYEAPQGFKLHVEKVRASTEQRKKTRLLEEERERREAAEEERERLKEERVRAYWDSLTEDEQDALWNKVSRSASPFDLKRYRSTRGREREREALEADPALPGALRPHRRGGRQPALNASVRLAPCKTLRARSRWETFPSATARRPDVGEFVYSVVGRGFPLHRAVHLAQAPARRWPTGIRQQFRCWVYPYLAKWDTETKLCRLTGVAANDCHRNMVLLVTHPVGFLPIPPPSVVSVSTRRPGQSLMNTPCFSRPRTSP